MAYAGETVEITCGITDFDGVTAVTPAQIGNTGSVTVEVVDANNTVFVPGDTMIFDTLRNVWYYLWDTNGATPVPAGNYRGKVTVTAVDGTVSFEYLRISLRQPTF